MERREIIDMASGIAGGLLLVLAIVLFAVVPQDEPVPPTFQVQYVATEHTVDMGTSQDFEEGDTLFFPITIDSQYVYRISFNVTWTDDVVASDPDEFTFHINGPDGERVTQGIDAATNPEPEQDPSDPTGSTYVAYPGTKLVEKSIDAPPRDGPVPGAHLNEDATNARSRLLEDLVTSEPGDWELEVYLAEAGDCPAPADAPEQAFACQAETSGGGEDDGNSLQVVSITYVTYDVQIEEVTA